jgi:hypothetical protein
MQAEGKRALLSCCILDPWEDVVQKLSDDNYITPAYWIGWNDLGQENRLLTRFPGLVFHDISDAWMGNYPDIQNLDTRAGVIDAQILDDFSRYELTAIKMMDRLDSDGNTFSFNERQRHYRNLLRKWIEVIDSLEIELVISPSIPHRVFDYVLYVATLIKHIPYISYMMTTVKGLLIPVKNPEKLPHSLYHYRDYDVTKFELSTRAASIIDNLKGQYAEAKPSYMVSQDETNKHYNPIKAFKRYSKAPFLYLKIASNLMTPSRSYLKQKGKRLESSNYSRLGLALVKRRGRKKKRGMKQFYESLVKVPDYKKKYILVALHYQPEETSTPSGLTYTDQYLMIDMLSRLIPNDWLIYVKEHKSQFHPLMEGQTGRKQYFYTDLQKLENVKCVSTNEDVFKLIDNAKAVATLTGTIGFESVVRGTPALVFGNAWYAPLDQVFQIWDNSDLKAAIDYIKTHQKKDSIEDISKYLKMLENGYGIYAYHYKGYKKYTGLNKTPSIAALSDSIRRILDRPSPEAI